MSVIPTCPTANVPIAPLATSIRFTSPVPKSPKK
jgi:hypothetical protein